MKKVIILLLVVFVLGGGYWVFDNYFRGAAYYRAKACDYYQAKDYPAAFQYNLKAAYAGDKNGMSVVTVDYYFGTGTVKDNIEGLAWNYVSVAYDSDNKTAADCIPETEKLLNTEEISKAQARAKEIMQAIRVQP